MSQQPRHEIATKRVVLNIAGTDTVKRRLDVPYAVADGEQLTMDISYPTDVEPELRRPAVLFITGYSDEGARRVVGCNMKDMASFVSWSLLMAASGIAAVTYTTRRPATDVLEAFRYLHGHAGELGVDTDRIGLWACSGSVPTALSLLMALPSRVRCAALCYGYMLDFDGEVAEAAARYGFANPCAGRSIEDLPRDVPLLVVRAGRDETPRLNQSLDRFVGEALARNLALTLLNYPTGPHAFDIVDDCDESRQMVRQVLEFMTRQLKKPA